MSTEHAQRLFDAGGEIATAMFQRVARSIKIEHETQASGKVRPGKRVEFISGFLDVFEPVMPDGEPVEWPEGSSRPPFSGPNDPRRVGETAEVVRELVRIGKPIKFVVPLVARTRLDETYTALQGLLDTTVAPSTHMQRAKDPADVVNILFKRDGFDKALVPTGNFHFSAFEIEFYAVKINRVRENVIKQDNSILDAGESSLTLPRAALGEKVGH